MKTKSKMKSLNCFNKCIPVTENYFTLIINIPYFNQDKILHKLKASTT